MTEHLYASINAPKLRIKLRLSDGTVIVKQFKNGTIMLNDLEAEAFDKQIAERAAVSQYVRKVDREAALRAAKMHQAEMLAQNAASKSGDSESIRRARQVGMAARDAGLAAQGDLDKLTQQLDENENLVLTEKADIAPSDPPADSTEQEKTAMATAFAKLGGE